MWRCRMLCLLGTPSPVNLFSLILHSPLPSFWHLLYPKKYWCFPQGSLSGQRPLRSACELNVSFSQVNVSSLIRIESMLRPVSRSLLDCQPPTSIQSNPNPWSCSYTPHPSLVFSPWTPCLVRSSGSMVTAPLLPLGLQTTLGPCLLAGFPTYPIFSLTQGPSTALFETLPGPAALALSTLTLNFSINASSLTI